MSADSDRLIGPKVQENYSMSKTGKRVATGLFLGTVLASVPLARCADSIAESHMSYAANRCVWTEETQRIYDETSIRTSRNLTKLANGGEFPEIGDTAVIFHASYAGAPHRGIMIGYERDGVEALVDFANPSTSETNCDEVIR